MYAHIVVLLAVMLAMGVQCQDYTCRYEVGGQVVGMEGVNHLLLVPNQWNRVVAEKTGSDRIYFDMQPYENSQGGLTDLSLVTFVGGADAYYYNFNPRTQTASWYTYTGLEGTVDTLPYEDNKHGFVINAGSDGWIINIKICNYNVDFMPGVRAEITG